MHLNGENGEMINRFGFRNYYRVFYAYFNYTLLRKLIKRI